MPPPAEPPSPRAVAVVPARLGSTRLERKMLLAETGLPLFAHTARRAALAPAVTRVVVATDSCEVLEAARHAGLEAVATRADHPSGTDRVLEALEALDTGGETPPVVLNVQGDEPEIDPDDLTALVAAFADPEVEVATLAAELASPAEAACEDTVKVVCDQDGWALYFSRAPIPHIGRARPGADQAAPPWRRHVGVYAFRHEALRRFCALPVGRLERLENLEQLRWLEAGLSMRVVAARSAPPGIDTRADYDAFVARVRTRARPDSPPVVARKRASR